MERKKIIKKDAETDFFVRRILLSTGEFTYETVIRHLGHNYHDSAPIGLTTGLKETQSKEKFSLGIFVKKRLHRALNTFSQKKFDAQLKLLKHSQVGTAFSMSFLKLLAQKNNFSEKELFKYISKEYAFDIKIPKIICNILNGGKHARNKLSFCEFMIIPTGNSARENVRIASEVYRDLESIIEEGLGVEHLYLGREGGYAPVISNINEALSLIEKAIKKRNDMKCHIAIDVAANNFTVSSKNNNFQYKVDKKIYNTDQLVTYYCNLIESHPLIKYLEDPFHEQDIGGWKKLFKKISNTTLIVADDLTVSNIKNLQKDTYQKCFNACILKTNQSGSISTLIEAFNYCKNNKIKTIVSQRSGETDSNSIVHLAVGLGSEYLKAGAPARERIVKYNELIRLETDLEI